MAMTDPVTGADLYEGHFEVGTRITDKVSLKLDPGSELAQFIDSLIPVATPGTPGTDHRPTAVGIDAVNRTITIDMTDGQQGYQITGGVPAEMLTQADLQARLVPIVSVFGRPTGYLAIQG